MNQAANVLIADDEELFRESIKGFLSAKGYACTCVGDAPEASRLITEQPYDLLISDIVMPGNSDLQLVLEVEKKTPWIPIILVTGHPSVETAVKAVRLPVYSYLLKPVEFSEILPLVEQFVARGRLLRIITSVRSRMKGWSTELDQLAGLLSGPAKLSLSEPAGILLAGIFETLVKSLGDMGFALATLHATENVMPRSDLSVVESKLKLTRQTLQDAIGVLEQSKNVFKSKRLGEIRKQFQDMLENLAR